jgi:hypothetical protein
LFVLLSGSCHLSAQVTAIAAFSSEKIETGDTFNLKILVSGTNVAPGTVSFQRWAAQIPLNNFLRISDWRRSGQQWQKTATLIVFDSLKTELPPLYVRTHLGDSVPTNAVQLTVLPTPATAELSDMEPIREIRREPTSWTDYWPQMLLGLAALGGLFWWYRKKNQSGKPKIIATAPAPPAAPPPAAQEIALRRLAQLEQQQLWKTGNWYAHFTEISLITREYLEKQYRFPALESTTTEIGAVLENLKFPASLKGLLQELLNRADGVKYARSKPTETDCRHAIDKVRFLIEQTAGTQPIK